MKNENNDFVSALKSKKSLAIMSYLWIFSIVPFLISKDEFVQFHAKQGFVLFLVEVCLVFVGWIPIIGWILVFTTIVFSILGIKSVLNEQKWEMPFINKLSKKIKL